MSCEGQMTLDDMMMRVRCDKLLEELKMITDEVLPRWSYLDDEWNNILMCRMRLRKEISKCGCSGSNT